MSRKEAVLFSGGLDSYLLWRLRGMPPALFFVTGTRSNERERAEVARIRSHWTHARIYESHVPLGRYEQPDGYLPYRNLMFILYASLDLPEHDLLIGQIMEWQTDKNAAFYRRARALVSDLGYSDARILAPLAGMTRTEAVAEYLRRGFNVDELTTLTYSCATGNYLHCGRCSSCINRWIAFTNNGVEQRMDTRPTREAWLANARAQRRIFQPHLFPMYVRRWLEGERAFKRRP